MKIQEIMSTLNGLSIDEDLTIRERAAVNEALMAMSNIIYKKENQTDFQGWPIKKLTMKQWAMVLEMDIVQIYTLVRMKIRKRKYKFGSKWHTRTNIGYTVSYWSIVADNCAQSVLNQPKRRYIKDLKPCSRRIKRLCSQ